MRRRCDALRLRVESITLETWSAGGSSTPVQQLMITIAPQTLYDGQYYVLELSAALPTGLAGTEEVVVNNGTTVIYLGDYRSRIVRSERVRYKDKLCLDYSENSLAGASSGTVTPAFVVVEGLHVDP